MSYEQLDTIADAYIPFLGLLMLAKLTRYLYKKAYAETKTIGLETLFGIASVYSLMAIDNHFHLWPM